jgi:hypothetical protein
MLSDSSGSLSQSQKHLTLTDPVVTNTGSRIPGLPLGRPRSHALLSALLTFRTQIAGFTNRDCVCSPPSSAAFRPPT